MVNAEGQASGIAARLRAAREMAGLTQGQAAKLMQMHRPSISESEAGRRGVSADELVKFARLYGVDVRWLSCAEADHAQDPKVELAARELSRLKPEDLDRLMQLIEALKARGE